MRERECLLSKSSVSFSRWTKLWLIGGGRKELAVFPLGVSAAEISKNSIHWNK